MNPPAVDIKKELDRIESTLSPGHGRIDFGAYTRGTGFNDMKLGIFADAEARISKTISGYGRVDAERDFGLGKTVFGASMGLRMRF